MSALWMWLKKYLPIKEESVFISRVKDDVRLLCLVTGGKSHHRVCYKTLYRKSDGLPIHIKMSIAILKYKKGLSLFGIKCFKELIYIHKLELDFDLDSNKEVPQEIRMLYPTVYTYDLVYPARHYLKECYEAIKKDFHLEDF